MGKVRIRKVGISEFVEKALEVFLDPRAELTKEEALKLISSLEKEYGIEISWETLHFDDVERIVVRSYRFRAEEIEEAEFFRKYGIWQGAEAQLKDEGYVRVIKGKGRDADAVITRTVLPCRVD